MSGSEKGAGDIVPRDLPARFAEWEGRTIDVSALRLPDIIAPDLAVLFVGFNPSVYAALRGHYYARPSNRFYPLLHHAGLTPRRYAPEEDRALLDLGIGITDLCPIPTPGVADVPRAVAESGRAALNAKIERYRPRIVCFNGKATYERYFGHAPAGWGLQADRLFPGGASGPAGTPPGTPRDGCDGGPSRVFVVPSSSGRANAVGAAREAAFVALGELVHTERDRR